MKTRTGKIIFSIIAVVVGISAIIILLCAINTNQKSEQEIKEIDTFIESIEEHSNERIGISTDLPTMADSGDSRNISTDSSISSNSESSISSNSESTEEIETTLTAEELAQIVIDSGINGDARKEYLGNRYEEVQKWIDANYVPPVRYVEAEESEADAYYPSGGGVLTPSAGVNYFNGRMETYYNLDMSGVLDIMYSLGYSGDYWVRGDGVKMFGNYIMVACDFGEYPRGSIIETSLGTAMVCDTGSGGWGWTDIAVTW